jgi:flagellar biogenesis protein FliO
MQSYEELALISALLLVYLAVYTHKKLARQRHTAED